MRTGLSDDSSAPAKPLERFYGVLVLLGLTLGPVYQLRIRAFGLLRGDFLDDPMVQLTFASLDGVALVLLGRRALRVDRRRGILVLVALFDLAVLASTFWSVDRNRTFTQGVLLLGSSAVALYFADRHDDRALAMLLFGAMQVGAITSAIALRRYPSGSRDPLGQWTGIYLNRNSLGPVAALGIASGLYLAVDAGRRRRPPAIVIAALLPFLALDAVLLVGSRSATPLAGLIAFVVVAVVTSTTTGHMARSGSWSPASGAAVASAPIVVGAAALAVARNTLLRALGKNATLEGRVPLWRLVWGWIRVHPVRGSGWMAVWARPDYQEQVQNKLFSHEPAAHSGYLETALGTGFVGAAILAALLAVGAWRVWQAAVRRPGLCGSWRVALFAYIVVVNGQETFVGANLLVWVLALAVALAPLPVALPAVPPPRSA